MPQTESAEFDGYFDKRASRFAAFYRSEQVSRLLGRGPLFDRLSKTVHLVGTLGSRRCSTWDVAAGLSSPRSPSSACT